MRLQTNVKRHSTRPQRTIRKTATVTGFGFLTGAAVRLRFLPAAPAARYECLQWLFFQVGGIGPMFGQLGFFHKFAGREWEDKRPRDRYAAESRRLVGVVNQRLATRRWMMGEEFTVADIAIFPMMRNLIGFYGAGELVGFGDFPNVQRALDEFLARPAVQRGLAIPKRA